MNQGFYGFSPGGVAPPPAFTYPIIASVLNCSSGGNSQTVKFSPFGYVFAASNSACANNLLFLHAHWVPRPCLITQIVAGVVLPSVSGNAHFGLFSSDPTTGFPETCLYSSASTATATGYNDFGPSCNVTINTPGWYWTGIVFDTNNVGPIQTISTNSICLFPSSSGVSNYQGTGLRVSHTFGPMPPSLSGAKFTLVESGTGFPATCLTMAPLNPRNPIQRG